MKVFLAILLFGGLLLPKDDELSAQLAGVMRRQFAPTQLTVEIRRASPFTLVIDSLLIDMGGFTVQNTPLLARDAAADADPLSRHAFRSVAMSELLLIDQLSIGRASVRCHDFSVHDFPINELTLDVNAVDVTVPRRPESNMHITSQQPIAATIVIDQEKLLGYLQEQTLPITLDGLEFAEGECRISGLMHQGIAIPVTITGQVVGNGAALSLANMKIRAVGLGLPKHVTEAIEQRMNPIIDLHNDLRLPGTVLITSTKARDGQLRVAGTITLVE